MDPFLIASWIFLGCWPFTLQPTLTQVPSTSSTAPVKVLAMDLCLRALAISITSSREMDPLCLMFLTFLRSLGGSLRALMIMEAAEGTTSTLACRFCTVTLTVIFRPFQSLDAAAMSSPIFFGDRPRGPTLGAV